MPAVPVAASFGQDTEPAPEHTPEHVFWLVPNYRTTTLPADYEPLSLKEKMKLAAKDSFDRGTFAPAGVVAGISRGGNFKGLLSG